MMTFRQPDWNFKFRNGYQVVRIANQATLQLKQS